MATNLDHESRPPATHKRQYQVRGDATIPSEFRLSLAVLEEAIHCFQKHLFARDRHGRKLFREAEAWIMSEDDPLPFSFEHLCAVIGINPAYVRRGLRSWRERQLTRQGYV